MTNHIITTCKNRVTHLRVALASWRDSLPDWVPIVSAVDDPAAVAATREIYARQRHIVVESSEPGWRKLKALKVAVDALPEDAERVVFFDCDIIAVFPTSGWLDREFEGFCVPNFPPNNAYPHDFGVVLAHARHVRAAWELLAPSIGDWEGYGSEDVLIRCAYWLVTTGRINSVPIQWAHIPHGEAERVACYPRDTSATEQHHANMARFDRDLPRMCATMGIDLARSTILRDCLGDWRGRRYA